MKTLGNLAGEDAPRPARRNPEASRRALIEATLDCIAEDGIAETSVSRIIERAGLLRPSIQQIDFTRINIPPFDI